MQLAAIPDADADADAECLVQLVQFIFHVTVLWRHRFLLQIYYMSKYHL